LRAEEDDMHVLLVGAELEENLALRYLAAALQGAGHSVDFAAFENSSQTAAVLAAVTSGKPALVGLSMTFQFRAKEFGALAAELRASGFRGHITAGGHFPTFAFREVLASFPDIDTVVRHEGELTLPELCAALEKNRPLDGVRGLVFRKGSSLVENPTRPLIEDLNALPFPVRTGDPQLHLGVPAAFLVGTRGCYGHCTFCCIHAYLKEAGGSMYRARSPEDVAEEMAELRRSRGVRMFVFHDDDFFTRDHARDLARLTALRDALRARGVTDIATVVKARPDDVDEEVFAVLEQIGLLRVYLGIEAGSTEGLRTLGRGVDLAENHRALSFLRDHDLYTCFNMLLFDPESTLRSLRQSLDFLRAYADVPMNFCRTEIYVGTPLMHKLAREGRLRGDVFGWDYSIREPAAERAFRVFADAFLDRNFRCDGLMNATLGLGYHLHLLRTFYPGALTPALRRLVTDTTRRVNLDCVERMSKILDFAASPASEDPNRHADFTAETTEEVVRANATLEDQVAWATQQIVEAALAPRPNKPSRSLSAWQAVTAATLALAPLACDPVPHPPPPDPLPPPTLFAGPPDAGQRDNLPPPDPPPPPVIRDLDAGMVMPPMDPPPPPVTKPPKVDAGVPVKATGPVRPPPPPPDPLPPPKIKP
jgi:anaerobic magnesium-protoporphyrin IX monomethyl ester cyclase